jgi:MoaA/NifB/PqqE/SkfB family radical SAM enzyme
MPDIGNIIRRTSRVLAVPIVERGYRPPPVYLFLEMNRRCNHRCIMCDIWKTPTDGMPREQIERIFTAPFFDKLERVILAGGEPTMRTDLLEVSSFFIHRLPRLRAMAILTNGFNTRRTVDLADGILDLMDAGSRTGQYLAVQISLDAIGETYDKIRGIPKAWARTESTVLQLRDLSLRRANLGLMLHVVMQPQNLSQLPAIDQFAHELGVSVLFSPAVISDTYFGNSGQESALAFSDSERALVREFVLAREEAFTDALPFYYLDIASMLEGSPRSRRCMMGYYIMYVKMDGTVFPCINSGDHALGDLTTQSPEEVWRGPTQERIRRTVRREFCPSCTSACDNDITSVRELAVTVKNKLQGPAPR